jgi:phosphoribosylglycinamide formyltransferase-1
MPRQYNCRVKNLSVGKSSTRPTARPIVVLVSGRGSNLQALLSCAKAERWATELGATVVAVVSSRADADGLTVARVHDVPVHILLPEQFASRSAFDESLARTLDRYAPDLIVLAGFMRVLTPAFVRRYAGRIVNIHPSLLPSFPGLNTHQRALDAGVRVHGATVHFVSDEVDAGPIIAQAAVAVHADDDEASLAARVLQQEHRLLPHAVRHVLEGRVRFSESRALLVDIRHGELSLLAS